MTAPRVFSGVKYGVFFILALAFALRLIGIRFGLPYVYHADEPIVVNHALAYGSGDLNPHFFKIPPLVSYLLFLLYGFFYLLGHLAGRFHTTEDFLRLFLDDPTAFYLIARIVFGAILGTATVWALYRIVKKNFSRRTALIGAFLFAANFLHVRDSHYIYADIPLVFLLVLSLGVVFDVLTRASLRDYLLFGCLTAAAAAVKYNGVFIWAPFLIAHLIRNGFSLRSIVDRKLWMAAFFSVIVFFLLNPFAVLDFRFFLTELHGQSGAESFTGWTHHLRYSLAGGAGLFVLLLFLAEAAVMFVKPNSKEWVLLSFPVAYYAVLVRFSQPYDRYVLPLIPFVIVLAASGIARIGEKLRWGSWVYFGFVFLAAAPSLAKIYHSDRIFLTEDNRSVAKRWVEQNIPSESKIALEEPFFMPRLNPALSQLEVKEKSVSGPLQKRRIQSMIQNARERAEPKYELYFLREGANGGFLFSEPNIPYDLDELKRQNIQYVLVAKREGMKQEKFYADLARQARQVARFSPFKDLGRDGPFDREPLTGGPFLWAELAGRTRNGQIIEVYRL